MFENAVRLHQSGFPQEAIEIYLRILPTDKNNPYLLFLVGTAFGQIGKHEEGVTHLQKSAKITPNPITYNNLAGSLVALSRYTEAIQHLRTAIELDPNYSEGYCNLGIAQRYAGLPKESVNSLEQAIRLTPNYRQAYTEKGFSHSSLGEHANALECHEYASKLDPNFADSYRHIGDSLVRLSRLSDSLPFYNKAIALNSNFTEAFISRGGALKKLGQLEDALANQNRAFALNPKTDYLLGTILHTQMLLCDWTDLDKRLDELVTEVKNREVATTPFILLALIDSPETHKIASESYVSDKYPTTSVKITDPSNSIKNSKIKVGYFSADFHHHATMHLMAELLESHDKSLFEFVAFSFGPITNDPWQLRAKDTFDKFIECHGQNDAEIAQISRNLGIDIAVDLKGFTQNARTGIFAARAAPIQVNFIGFPGTMGANYIDYLIGDEVLIPQKSQHSYTEKIAYLPDCYQPNCRTREVSNKPISRSDFGLPKEGIVFSSFNNNYKITPQVFASWMRILKAVEGSVLWLFSSNTTAEENLRKHAEENGVDPKRIVFAQKLPVDEHLNRIPLADLMLDTFPYGAHTTCSDALRMGLPVVTLKGESFASRVAASLLTTVGISELITDSHAAYESLAVELAKEPDKLAEIRARLALGIKTSSLFDPELFARNLESLYMTMYQRHQDGLPIDHIFASH